MQISIVNNPHTSQYVSLLDRSGKSYKAYVAILSIYKERMCKLRSFFKMQTMQRQNAAAKKRWPKISKIIVLRKSRDD